MPLEKIIISDDLSTGHSQGRIINLVWIGDHFQYIIRTDDDEDFVVNSDYSWNENDLVAVDILADDIKLRLKKDPENYVVR